MWNYGLVNFRPNEDIEQDKIQSELFQDFFTGIQKTHGNKIIPITSWCYTFRKGKDFEYILNNFPNIRTIQGDYRFKMFGKKIKINKILSYNGENSFQENDLCAFNKMVKNYIKQKSQEILVYNFI